MKEVFIKENVLKKAKQNQCITIDVDENKDWILGERVSIVALDKAGILRTGLYVLGYIVGMKQISTPRAAYPKVRYQFALMADCSKF